MNPVTQAKTSYGVITHQRQGKTNIGW